MKTYELQTYNRKVWKIDSMFDDAEMAVEEARRVEESRRYSGVRVIEENYDEETNRTASRTIFRGGVLNQPRDRKSPPSTINKPSAAGQPYGAGREPVRRTRTLVKRKKNQLFGRILIVVVCTIAGLLALIGIHQLELLH